MKQPRTRSHKINKNQPRTHLFNGTEVLQYNELPFNIMVIDQLRIEKNG